MPLYGQLQPGSNPDMSKNVVCVNVGDSYTLLNGTEDLSGESTASVAFARGAQGSDDGGMSFSASGMTPNGTIDIQVANENEDELYTTVNGISCDANGNGSSWDAGRSAFYRVDPGAEGSPASGVRVIVQR